jgi:hypothetical protein
LNTGLSMKILDEKQYGVQQRDDEVHLHCIVPLKVQVLVKFF